MIGFLFDLIFSLPISLLLLMVKLALFGKHEAIGNAPLFLTCIFVCLSVAAIRHAGSKVRISVGLTFFLIAARVIYYLYEAEDWAGIGIELAVAVACAMLGIILSFLILRVEVIRIAAGLAAIGSLVPHLFGYYSVSGFMLFFATFTAFAVIALEIQSRSKKEGDTDFKRHMVYTIAFILLGCVIISAVPAPNKPIDWSPVIKAYRYIEEKIYDLTRALNGTSNEDPDSFYYGFSDSSEASSLERGLTRDILEVKLTIFTSQEYFAGRMFNSFDGKRWTNTVSGLKNEINMDAVETYAAVLAKKPEYMTDYFKISRADVTFLTKDYDRLFVNGKAFLKRLVPLRLLATDAGGRVYTEGISTEETNEYSYEYIILNRYNDVVTSLIEEGREITRNEWDDLLALAGISTLGNQSYEEYQAYRAAVHKFYLEDEKIELSDKMKDFMDELLAGCDTPLKKADKIESLLASYDYNSKVGKMPESIDTPSEFLDYFVFTQREGYCVHFATAFVLMARSVGIPARYVQGYLTPVINGKATVTSDMAHAWAEAYFDGFGWVRFEPTPGRGRRISWDTEAEKIEINPLEFGSMGNMPVGIPDEGQKDEFEDLNDYYVDKEEINREFRTGFLMIILIAFPVLTVLILIIDLFFKNHRYNKLTPEEKLTYYLKRILVIFGFLGLPINRGETVSEFYDRIRIFLRDEPGIVCDLAASFILFEKVIYGGGKVTLSDVKGMRNCEKALLSLLAKKKKANYLYCNIKLLMG